MGAGRRYEILVSETKDFVTCCTVDSVSFIVLTLLDPSPMGMVQLGLYFAYKGSGLEFCTQGTLILHNGQ